MDPETIEILAGWGFVPFPAKRVSLLAALHDGGRFPVLGAAFFIGYRLLGAPYSEFFCRSGVELP